jgi:hypothetical protein
LYLSGDREHPSLRHVGSHADDFVPWLEATRDYLDAGGEDGELARWLLPSLLYQRAAFLDRDDATDHRDEAVALCQAALERCPVTERPWWRAHLLRAELARLSRQSGASRLFALRELGRDSDDDHAPALDAWIDIHLAWSGWLVGVAARARLQLAEEACTRLALADPPRAAHRRAEITLRHAALEKGDARLARLDHALALLHTTDRDVEDPSTLLLFAECAHQRAGLLAPDEAAEACSFALAHAFAAGQHPAWHIASLEMRLAIQSTHDDLSGRAHDGAIAATLRRELADARSLLRTGSA